MHPASSPAARRGNPTKPDPGDPELRARDERVESMKGLVGQLAHDFNNFLVPLLGYVTLIKEELSPAASAMNYALSMEASARKTEALLETVMLAVRPQRRFAAQSLDFAKLVERGLDEWEAGLPPSAQITVDRAIAPCTFVGDEHQWKNALLQLLHNARFALATGGRLEVRVSSTELTPEEGSRLGVQDGRCIELTVRDEGFGMSEAVLRRACEPFYSTRSRAAAQGLGLTVVHSVAHWHGGQLLIQSREDAGTTVRVLIPERYFCAAPIEEKPAVPAGAQPSVERRPMRRVLLVEDDPLVREVIKAYLERLSLEVLVAHDGAHGWRLFERHRASLALVVSDVTMPNMTGIELYENIRAQENPPPVLLMSGDSEATSMNAIARLGPQPPVLMKKPFSVRAFTETVRSFLPDPGN